MSNDQDKKIISDAYSDIATETTPAALDDKVLRMAEREAKTRYGLARSWTRPVAWAAMIGLSLAIVLEVTQTPDIAAQPDAMLESEILEESLAAPAAKEQRDADAMMDSAVMPAKERERARFEASQRSASPAAAAAEMKVERLADAEACTSAQRNSAASWHECILDLRERGLDEAAAAQLEALLAAFPDFEEPGIE